MHPSEPPFLRLQFYLTATYPCSYLPDRQARSQVAAPAHLVGQAAYSQLIRTGFRRSGDFTYRPHCDLCQSCVPVRVVVDAFSPSRSQRRCWRDNQNLEVSLRELEFDQAHFELYRRYQRARHPGGGMDMDDAKHYAQFLLTSQIDTRLVEFRRQGQLLMVAVVDQVEDGLSAVYSFFDPEQERGGLGTYAVLWQIELARTLGLPYVYLGYWIAQSRKMAYKSAFRPLQAMRDGYWRTLADG